MSLGKDSIQKRVAAAATATKSAPTKKTATAPKAAAPKSAAAKSAAPKKPAAPKTAVLTAVAPETVEKVIARKESDPVAKCAVGEALPYYLL